MKAVITGGTSGLGYGVACQLARLGWEVTIIGRDRQRGTQIAGDLGVRFMQANLSLMSEVDRLANEIEGSLDALVMCAGIVSMRREPQYTAEGYELTFATNYLSKFALSQRLLPKMMPEGCVVMLGGDGRHAGVTMDWDTTQTGMAAARMAGLAVDLYAAELAKRELHLRVHTCYPGIVKTNLLRDASWPIRLYMQILGASIEQGSAYITRLVTDRREGVHWDKAKPMIFSPPLPADPNRLFAHSLALIENHTTTAQRTMAHEI
jgi:NAD(P)-dependent dehydrogenase (short-subunit alcohol dehydrogenase family)